MNELILLVGNLLSNMLVQIIVAVGVLYVARFFIHRIVDSIVRRLVRGHLYASKQEEKQREDTLTSVFHTITTAVLWIAVGLFILSRLGVDIAAVATGAGLLGIVVGFGAQNAVKDFLGGIFIIIENQYRIGDVVTIGGHSGVVEEVTIRMTTLRDLDGSVYFVPNGQIMTVKNMTYEYSGVVIDIAVTYDTDIDKVKNILNEVGNDIAEDPEWKERIIEPVQFLRVEAFADSSILLRVLGKVTPIEQWNVAGEYRNRVKRAFEKNNIEIPFPQQVIHREKVKK